MYDIERERYYIKLASDDPDLTPEEEYEFYTKYALRTKEDLLTEARNTKKRVREPWRKKRSGEFYNRLDHLIDFFCEEVESHVILEPLDNFWGYMIEVCETGITLSLAHFMLLYDSVGSNFPDSHKYMSSHFLASDDKFPILKANATLLSLEEYGAVYNVGAGTVRQWIRRGKLRSASKFGNEWRVPELADKPHRGYSGGLYYWKTDIPDPPEEIPDINIGDSIHITKNNHTGEWTASVECLYKKGKEKKYVLTNKAKEKLELYLISHPLVECSNNAILDFSQKMGSEYEMMKVNPKWLELSGKISQNLSEPGLTSDGGSIKEEQD